MLILASASKARRSLLEAAGLSFSVEPALIDERAEENRLREQGAGSGAIAAGLAAAKALSVSEHRPAALVIGADQVLDFDGGLLHKPGSMREARDQLRRLAGKTHHLIAGLALARNGAVLWSHRSVATLTLRAVSDAELDSVLAEEGDAVLASVGGYRLEGPSIRLFEKLDGDYFTILGLPLLPLLAALRQHTQ